MSHTLTLAVASALLIGWGVFVFALAIRGGNTLYDPDNYDSTLCAPSRRANITASQPQAQRRTLGPPAGWREPAHVAIVPAPAAVEYDGADLDDWDDEPETELPLAVDDWPVPVVVAPVPVVVNSTAARFSALEIGGK